MKKALSAEAAAASAVAATKTSTSKAQLESDEQVPRAVCFVASHLYPFAFCLAPTHRKIHLFDANLICIDRAFCLAMLLSQYAQSIARGGHSSNRTLVSSGC